MSEQSYAVYKKSFDYPGPTLDQAEKFCFDARQRGAAGNVNIKLNDYHGGSFQVDIPEADLTTPYASPDPKSIRRNPFIIPLLLVLLVVSVVVGVLV